MAQANFIHLTAGSADSGSESLGNQTTANVQADANKIVFVAVGSNKPSGTPNAPTVTGSGFTFTQVSTVLSADNKLRMTLFRGVGGGNATLTISHGGQNQQNIYWSVLAVEKLDTDGVNGANAVVQSATGTGIGQTNFLATLGAFANGDNQTLGVVYQNTSQGVTQGSGFTELNDFNPGIHGIETEYKNSNDTSVDWSVAGGANYVAVAVELKFKDSSQDDYAYLM